MQSGPTLAHEPGGQRAGAAVWRGTFPRWPRLVLACWLLALGIAPAHAQTLAAPRLEADAVASVDRVRPGDSFQIAVVLRLPAGIHVNAHTPSDASLIPTRVQLAAPPGLKVGAFDYPPGNERQFRFTDQPIAVYEGETAFTATATVTATPDLKPGILTLRGSVEAQACNDASCFPPARVPFSLALKVVSAGTPVQPANAEVFGGTAGGASGGETGATTAAAPPAGNAGGSRAHYPRLDRYVPAEEFGRWLQSGSPAPSGAAGFTSLLLAGNWLLALPLIFLGGLALNLTPCVYPLIPITVGFFGSQSGRSRGRMLALAGLYVLGMALMYSTLGVVAALTGGLFGSQLQNPYVLGGFALVMVALALSMFGLWEIRLPVGLTSRVSGRTGFAGALLMGLLVGFVAAPCIGPVVVALLQVVGTLGRPALGFAVFFVLALGLGLPYLILAYFSGLIQKLPRSGEWMNGVKRIFGLVMLWMALYYLGPVMGAGVYKIVAPAYTLAAGLYLLLLDRSGAAARRFFVVKRGIGVAAVLAGLFLFFPRGHAAEGIPFEAYDETKVQQALAEGRGVLIDFRADWCAACKELEAKTFTDPRVIEATRGLLALKHDLTRQDDPEAVRVATEYGVVGLPTVIFIPPR
ncbi:MAG: hypothetical protein GX774_21005 [Armatimonadetes bacterium]|nr:hypothetical protein [Armatimonadota bacterium]